MHCTNVRIVGIMWISFAKLLKMLLSYAKNWGKTQRSKNHFDHIKQATRRTVLLATKTPIKSKSNKILPKKTPMAPWEHREVQATKISFLGGSGAPKAQRTKKNVGSRKRLRTWKKKFIEHLTTLPVFSKNLHVLNKSSDLWSRQIHPNACPLYTHKLQTTSNIQHHLLPATSSTGTSTNSNKNTNKNKQEEPPPFRIGQVTQSPRCGQNGRVVAFLRQVEPTAATVDQTFGLDSLESSGLKEVLPCGFYLNSCGW